MNSRQRIISTLKHKEPDRVPIDLSSTNVTGITGIAYYNLKRYLGINKETIKIIDPIQQLAQPEPEILQKFRIDTRSSSIEPEGSELDVLPNGIPCKVVSKISYISDAEFKPQAAMDGSKVLLSQNGQIL